MERAKRIELSSQPWQGRVLPLNHARRNCFYLYSIAHLVASVKRYFAALADVPKSCPAIGFK